MEKLFRMFLVIVASFASLETDCNVLKYCLWTKIIRRGVYF